LLAILLGNSRPASRTEAQDPANNFVEGDPVSSVTRKLAFLLVGLAVLTPSRSAEAQLGRLKDKLLPKSKQEPAKNKPAEAGPVFDETVLRLTTPVIEGFLRGRQLEISLLKEFKELLAKYPAPDKYQKCRSEAGASPEFQKLMLSLVIPETASTEEGQRLMTNHQQELDALLRKRCPFDPGDWTLEKKRERLKAIVEQAAAAAGPVEAPDGAGSAPPSFQGPWLSEELQQARGMSVPAYKMVDERTVTFCRYVKAQGKPPAPIGNTVFLPSPNDPKLHYVYFDDEATNLLPHCRGILNMADQALAYDPAQIPMGGGPATCCADGPGSAHSGSAPGRGGVAGKSE
jgi:hypothetical protein